MIRGSQDEPVEKCDRFIQWIETKEATGMSEKTDIQESKNGSPSHPQTISLPEQKAFFKIPARFGHVPVAEEPLGYDHERRFFGDKNEVRSFTDIWEGGMPGKVRRRSRHDDKCAFGDIQFGTVVSIACRVQDKLGGEGMKAMKLKVE
ncbi:MAG: hypothetical protein V1809_15740 [Planctomycetota bacterium]